MSPRRTVQVPWLCALRCQTHCQGLSPGAPSPLRSGCQLSAPGQLPPPHCGGGGAGLGQPSGLQELRDGEGEGSSPGGRSPSSPAWDAGRDCLSTGPGPLGRGPLLPQVHARAWGLGQGLRAGLRCGRRGRSAQCARARQVQLPGRRRAGAQARPLAHAVTLAAPRPSGGQLSRAGKGRPAGETRHIRPGPRYLGPGQAAPSLVSIGDPAGGPGHELAGGGVSSAQHPNMAREGERHSCGRRGGGCGARGLYKTGAAGPAATAVDSSSRTLAFLPPRPGP